MAGLMKALGHPARMAIVDYLLEVEECIGQDFVQQIALAQPTISKHLKELCQAGVLSRVVEGNCACYRINDVALSELQTYFARVVTHVKESNPNCCL